MHVPAHREAPPRPRAKRAASGRSSRVCQGAAGRAKARGITVGRDRNGEPVHLENLGEMDHQGGDLADDAKLIDEVLRDSAILGTIPPDTDLEKMREAARCAPSAGATRR